ncbi:transmembrane sensor [Catalinimonas alkaloidigena]|uniref:FecR family protein n=1 Tax=Catalinimonas alkaloidigena TaxID=1075417 RepID=UPI002405CF44|nr:FecR domain-containing protein [Catalinimonas alkaloidigena]MDF9796952.1 transmembrane sensor [Catalinimonas alkaloidigena]
MNKQETIADLMLDDSFQAWVYSGEKKYDEKWQRWIREHPDKVEVLEEAKVLLQGLREEKHPLPEVRKDILRQELIRITQHADLRKDENIPAFESTGSHKRFKLGIAASIAFLIMISWAYFQYRGGQSQSIHYKTTFGEISSFVLPDCTQVTLNGNSQLTYRFSASAEKGREVWLAGEGFFDVSHMNADGEDKNQGAVKFTVHTDNLSIKVLGTRFNVKSRHEKTQVVLEKGSIQLDIGEQGDPLLMQPDELVEVKSGERQINQQFVEALAYTAWKEGVINLDAATFEEISSVLKDNYGLEILFVNENVADEIKLRGSFPSSNIDILLEAIANVTHTTMKKKGKTIVYQ